MGYQLQFYGVILNIVFYSTLVTTCHLLNGFIVLDINYNNFNNSCFSINVPSNVDVNTWYVRLWHIGQEIVNRLIREDLLGSLAQIDLPIYENCLAGKATRKPFGRATRAKSSL